MPSPPASGLDRLLDDALRPGVLRIRPFALSLADAGVILADVLAHPRVGRLHTLEIAGQDLPPSEVDTLLAWPGLSRVRCLHIHNNELGAEGVLRLLRSPQLQQLRALLVHSAEGRIADEAAAAQFVEELALRTPLPGVRFLRFGAHGGGAAAGRAVGRLASFPSLTHLHYGLSPGSGNAVVVGLVAGERLASLRELALDSTGVDDDALRRLLRSGQTHRLRTLSLRLNSLSDDGHQALADARGALPALERLVLSNGWVGEGVPLAVMAGMDTPRLRWLDLGGDRDPHALDALLRAPFLPQLRGLRLRLDARQEGVRRFLVDPRLAKLRWLHLDGLRLDRDDLALFRAQPHVLDGVLGQWFTDTCDRGASLRETGRRRSASARGVASRARSTEAARAPAAPPRVFRSA